MVKHTITQETFRLILKDMLNLFEKNASFVSLQNRERSVCLMDRHHVVLCVALHWELEK